MLYELLAGQPPYSGDSFVAVAMRHVNDPVPGITHARPDVPLRVDAALRRAMAKDPDDRFQTMDELVAELSACLARPRRARRRPDGDRRALRCRRARARSAAAAGGLVAARVLLVGLRPSPSRWAPTTACAARTRTTEAGRHGGAPVQLVASNAYDPSG